MDIKKLLGLRPKEQTAVSIGEAIQRAAQSKEAAQAWVAEMEAGRGTLLLQGDPKAIETAERELAEARTEIERCEVLAKAMTVALEEAAHREKVSEIGAAHDEAVKQVAAFITWWQTEYAPLARKMRDGAMMERDALRTITQLTNMMSAHPAAFKASGVRIPLSPEEHIFPGFPASGGAGVTSGLYLPPLEGKPRPQGSSVPFWPSYGEAATSNSALEGGV
jgi:hypothetical protein